MKTLSVVNQKGGVGKTTTALELAGALTKLGMRTLLVDLDAQCNTTSIMHRGDYTKEPVSILDVFFPSQAAKLRISKSADPKRQAPYLSELIMPSRYEGLDYINSTIRMALLERRFGEIGYRPFERVRSTVENDKDLQEKYDVVIFDTPPSLGVAMVNALSASNFALIVIDAENVFSLEGLFDLQETITNAIEINPTLKTLGYLITRYHGKKIVSRQIVEQIERLYGKETILETMIHVNTAIPKAHGTKKLVVYSNTNERGAQDYMLLAAEIGKKIGLDL